MYLGIIKAYWKESIAYRADYLFSILSIPLQFAVLVMIWSAVYLNSTGKEIGGYTIESLITYFMISTLVYIITFDSIAAELELEVRQGRYIIYTLLPISYIKLRFIEKIACRSFSVVTEMLPILLIFLIFLNNYFIGGNILLFIPSIILAFIISYFIYLIIGSLAFWFVNIRTFSWIVGFFIGITAGNLVPLDLFPKTLQTILHFLPFEYINYIPVGIYLGKFDTNISAGFIGSVYFALLMQIVWCVILFILVLIVWKSANKRFSGVGT